MNITFCTRDDKAVRNWEKQCFRCAHGQLALVRGVDQSGKQWSMITAFLLGCPHVKSIHKKVGKDSHKSQPRPRVDLVPTSCHVPFSADEGESLAWKDIGLSDAWENVGLSDQPASLQVAVVPRKRWREFFGFTTPSPAPCAACVQSQIPAP
jgi:hypothetical protein